MSSSRCGRCWRCCSSEFFLAGLPGRVGEIGVSSTMGCLFSSAIVCVQRCIELRDGGICAIERTDGFYFILKLGR